MEEFSRLRGAVKSILPACRLFPQQVPNVLQLVPLHQLLGLLQQIHISVQQRNLGEGSCSAKPANPPLHTLLTVSKMSQRSLFLHADLRFQMQVYSHVFNQYVDKASQEEDQGQDGGPLDNHLLVFTQHLKHDFDTHTKKKQNKTHKSHRNV